MQGYFTGYGYRGKMHDGKWRTFATEAEYIEAYTDEVTE